MKDWRGEERHGTPPPPTPLPPFCLKTMPPLRSLLVSHLPYAAICLVKSPLSSADLWLCSVTSRITLYGRPGSPYPSWPVSLGQLEESPGSAFLLLFHIICLAITASLPWTWGIITIFQFKDSRGQRGREDKGLVWFGDCRGPMLWRGHW